MSKTKKNQRDVVNFLDKNIKKHIDFTNKCSMDKHDSFAMYFQASITNNEKWTIPKVFIA